MAVEEDRLRLLDHESGTEETDDRIPEISNNNPSGAYTINTDGSNSRNTRFLGQRAFLHLSKLYNFKSKQVCLSSSLVALLATVTCVLFPSIVKSSNEHTDVYCTLLFCSLTSTVLVTVATLCFKLCDHSLRLKPQISPFWLIQMGALYGFCGLAVFYSRDRNRVMCHLQDPLAAILLPATVFFHMFCPKVDKVSQLICMAVEIIGLFIAVDFQIWDEFSCHGNIIFNYFDDGDAWSSRVHVIWTLFYVAAIALLGFFYTSLDKQIKILASGNSCAFIPLEGVCDNQENNLDQPSTSSASSPQLTSFNLSNKRRNRTHVGNILVLFLWVQLISTLTVLLLFWTDFVADFTGSASNFRTAMSRGWSCYFGVEGKGGGMPCSRVATIAWIFIISYTVLIGTVMYLMSIAKHYSVNYTVGVLVLCLPLSTIWWSLFQTADRWRWAPVFSGEAGFTVVGLPVMLGSLVLYKYYADRQTIQN